MTHLYLSDFQESQIPQYITFAKNAWGETAYQASSNYIKWLYNENPLIAKKEDFIVVKNLSNNIVGCVHRLRQSWLINNQLVDVPTSHNLYVRKAYRNVIGAHLIFEALRHDVAVFIAASGGKLGAAHKKLKRFRELHPCWYRKLLKPITGTIKYTKHKLLPTLIKHNIILPYSKEVQYCLQPNLECLEQLVRSYEENTKCFSIKQYYNATLMKWRFFHKIGPKHILIFRQNDQGFSDFFIVSIGQHQGLFIGRIIETSYSSSSFAYLYRAFLHLLKVNHVDMISIFSADPNLNSDLQKLGYKPLEDPPLTFIYYNKQEDISCYRIAAAAGDFGFETISRDFS